jgi:hypothetical protein
MAELFLILLLPALIIFFILYVCRHYNFSLFPRGMKGHRPKPWKFPKVQKDAYRWDSFSSDESSESSSDSSDESSDDDDSIQRQNEMSGAFYGTMTPGGMYDRRPQFNPPSRNTPFPTPFPIHKRQLDPPSPKSSDDKPSRGRGRGRGRGRTNEKAESSRELQNDVKAKENEVIERLSSRGRGRGTNRGTRGTRGTRGNRKISVYDPDILDPSKDVKYIDEREYDSMMGADIPNE